MNKSAVLIDALLIGKTLEKNCAEKDSYYYETREWIQTLHCENKRFWVSGWGSALGHTEGRIMEIINNPELWEIQSTDNL